MCVLDSFDQFGYVGSQLGSLDQVGLRGLQLSCGNVSIIILPLIIKIRVTTRTDEIMNQHVQGVLNVLFSIRWSSFWESDFQWAFQTLDFHMFAQGDPF